MRKIGMYYDFETTGLKPGVAEPIELAAILFDVDTLAEIARYETGLMFVRRPEEVHPKALECNGYTMDEIMAGRDPQFAFMELVGWLNRHVGNQRVYLAGHNVAFDNGFLQQAFEDYIPQLSYFAMFEQEVIDTKNIAKDTERKLDIPVYEGKRSRNTLENLTTHFNIEHANAHTAMADVVAGLNVLREFTIVGIENLFSVPKNHYATA